MPSMDRNPRPFTGWKNAQIWRYFLVTAIRLYPSTDYCPLTIVNWDFSVRKLRASEIGAQRQTPESLAGTIRLPVVAVLDNIRSLYNVGSMFRTADGALLEALYLTGYTPRPPRKEIDKTALGATHSVPWHYFADPLAAIASARERGAKVCVLEQTTSSRVYHTVGREEFPICLVVGNELTGVSEGILAAADFAIEIPMFGIKHSLNAAVAFGVAVFELSRIWRSGQPIPSRHH